MVVVLATDGLLIVPGFSRLWVAPFLTSRSTSLHEFGGVVGKCDAQTRWDVFGFGLSFPRVNFFSENTLLKVSLKR